MIPPLNIEHLTGKSVVSLCERNGQCYFSCLKNRSLSQYRVSCPNSYQQLPQARRIKKHRLLLRETTSWSTVYEKDPNGKNNEALHPKENNSRESESRGSLACDHKAEKAYNID